MAGYEVDPGVTKAWDELRGPSRMHRYIIFKIQNKSVITVDSLGDRSASYGEFLEKFPENEPRYAVFRYEYFASHDISGPRDPRQNIVYFFWCPDRAGVRLKMEYSSGDSAIQKALTGRGLSIRAIDLSYMEEDQLLSRLRGG